MAGRVMSNALVGKVKRSLALQEIGRPGSIVSMSLQMVTASRLTGICSGSLRLGSQVPNSREERMAWPG